MRPVRYCRWLSPTPGFECNLGSGTTNDGKNTGRRFFGNPEITADITGLNKELTYRFGVIFRTRASGWATVNTTNFEKYSLHTAELFVSLYP